MSIRQHLDSNLPSNAGRTTSFVEAEGGGQFGVGIKYFSPGWFMQAQQVHIWFFH